MVTQKKEMFLLVNVSGGEHGSQLGDQSQQVNGTVQLVHGHIRVFLDMAILFTNVPDIPLFISGWI